MTQQLRPISLDFIRALGNEARVAILCLFLECETALPVGQIAERLQMGQLTASEHLSILKRANILQSSRRGKEVFYQPDREGIVASLRQISEFLQQCCDVQHSQGEDHA